MPTGVSQADLVPYATELPIWRRSWSPKFYRADSQEVKLMHKEVKHLSDAGCTMADVMMTCMGRQIRPFKARDHPMYEYIGPDDSTWTVFDFYEGWSLKGMHASILKRKASSFRDEPSARPYFSKHPPTKVNI